MSWHSSTTLRDDRRHDHTGDRRLFTGRRRLTLVRAQTFAFQLFRLGGRGCGHPRVVAGPGAALDVDFLAVEPDCADADAGVEERLVGLLLVEDGHPLERAKYSNDFLIVPNGPPARAGA